VAVGGLALPSIAKETSKPRLAIVSLDGGFDGLTALPPFGDPDYLRTRGALALAPDSRMRSLINLDGCFGLHPALAPLARFFDRRELIGIIAAGLPLSQPTHGAARQKAAGLLVDVGGGESGWLYRSLDLLHPTRSLPVLAFGPHSFPELSGPRMTAGSSVLRESAATDQLLDSIAELHRGEVIFADQIRRLGYAGRPGLDFLLDRQRQRSRAFVREAAAAGYALARTDGPRVVALRLRGWDTHADQGAADGRLAEALAGLAEGLSMLAIAAGEAWHSTVTVVTSEFGRTVAPNATGGTDHGAAGVAFLLGGAVAGGRLVGHWPGLAADHLIDGAGLAPTTDLRSIFRSVAIEHLGLSPNAVDQAVFPGSIGTPPLNGLMRA
jgi:uncharacterized protein (DUF1501 family)